MSTERAIVVDSVFDQFENIVRAKGQELASALAGASSDNPVAVGELAMGGEKPASKVRALVEDALSKVSFDVVSSPRLQIFASNLRLWYGACRGP